MIKKYFYKTSIYFFFILFFTSQNIFAISSDFDEMNISNFLESQLFEMQDYKNQIYQEELYEEKYNQLKNKWMPNFNLTSVTGYSYDSDYRNEYPHGFYYSSKINFSQKLPLGISFDADLFSFTGNLNNDKILHSFDYLGSLQFSIPVMSYIFGFTESLIYSEKNESQNYFNYTTAYSRLTRKQIENFLKENICRYLYYYELQFCKISFLIFNNSE